MTGADQIKGILDFNARVLTLGTPNRHTHYEMSELKEMIFYNKIFISNTDEMFCKYDLSSFNEYLINYYIRLLTVYCENISLIMSMAEPIEFTNKDSFRRRYAMFNNIYGIESSWLRDDSNYRFESGMYFVSTTSSGLIRVSHIDPNLAVFKEPLSYENTCWKTEKCIMDRLHDDDIVDVLCIRVACDESGVVRKVEYIGNTERMRSYMPIFKGSNPIAINNPFFYIDDIDQMISRYIEEPVEVQEVSNITPIKLMSDDVLIEYPNDSFKDYLRLLEEAVNNPETEKIYITLYRIGSDESLYNILKDAVNHGIEVHCNIELAASGEYINKFWMDEFKRVGINVTNFGYNVIKVHAKLTLIKFCNGKSVCQIGTGNYHTKTTSQYTDLSLMTSDASICSQVERVFKIFDGDDDVKFGKDLLVTTYNARKALYELIDDEGDKGEDGYICIKCNALDDSGIIYHLDNAARYGCKIDLIVRGVCGLIPRDDNVMVKSIVWSKLEHSRVYAFGKVNPTIYIGSLDLVGSKINKRIETMVRIKDPDIMVKLCDYLNKYITTTTGSWLMDSKGNYRREGRHVRL